MKDVWEALADPTRRKILQLLRKQDMNAGDIAAHFDISKPSISHHLSILKQADLISAEKNGQNIIYAINTSVLEDTLDMISSLLAKGEKTYEK